MVIADETVRRALKGQGRAVQELLTACCPSVWRMAIGLTGDARRGRLVAEAVLEQSATVMTTWRDGVTPENWFYHHTLLTARRTADEEKPGDEPDVLLSSSEAGDDLPYHAFVRAMRGLPRQQLEAFLLNDGERLNPRLLGVAMDCSTSAAQVHLDAAIAALRAMAGVHFDEMVDRLARAYARLTPPPDAVAQLASLSAARARRGPLLGAMVRRAVFLAILAVLLAAGWHWRDRVIEWFGRLRAMDTPATRPSGT